MIDDKRTFPELSGYSLKEFEKKIQNMLLGIGIGDAFGAGYEFAFGKRDEFSYVDLLGYRHHSNPDFAHEPGMYTDDTQMSIAVSELIADDIGFSRENLAEYFVRAYKRDPAIGYAKGFKRFLESIESGEEFLERIRPRSERNGAAMRSVPIGLIPDPAMVAEYARTNASVTHNTPKGIASSMGVALIAHFNFYERRMPDYSNLKGNILPYMEGIDKETTTYLLEVCAKESSTRKDNSMDYTLLLGNKHKDAGVPCDGMRTLGAVAFILSRYDNPLDVLVESIRLGGDTDSVASIALGINLMHNDVSEIPERLYDGFTDHGFGKHYILQLGKRLANTIYGRCGENGKKN